MKVRITSNLDEGWPKPKEYEIPHYVVETLCGDDYERGALEAARATADDAVACLGRLLDLLADRGVIGAADFEKIIHGFVDEDLTKTEFIYPKITAGREQH